MTPCKEGENWLSVETHSTRGVMHDVVQGGPSTRVSSLAAKQGDKAQYQPDPTSRPSSTHQPQDGPRSSKAMEVKTKTTVTKVVTKVVTKAVTPSGYK
ncbi:unnamed protein product [Linum trigynum]|uniref:Uncharacterized protein n=1 Tax=Linum trigynum TaxID=586398 RepID=A0AAV2EWZ9_9ROSI